MMVATLRAVNRNWQESLDEATEEAQNQEKEKEEDTDDVFHPQDPAPEEDPETKSLNLINVAGVFYILIVGLILSLIVGILELLYSARSDALKDNVNIY